MAFQFFAPKTLGSLTIGAGALTGGGAIYWYQMPRTWKELLVKEGFLFLSTDEDYKGMFNDQKTNTDWTTEDSLKDSNESNVKTNAEKYCNEKLAQTLPTSYDATYSKTKKNLIDFCTYEGIQTTKGKLIQSQAKNWLSDSDDEKYKIIFAVYRYNKDFISWLKEVDSSGSADLSEKSTVDTGYTKLKSDCDNLLKMKHREVTNENYFKYVSWWCVDLEYTTIKDKIQKSDPSWDVRPQSDSDWETLKNTWQYTDKVKEWAKKANGDSGSDELTSESLKKLCNTSYVEAQLSSEDSYQEKYIVIKSVCKKEK